MLDSGEAGRTYAGRRGATGRRFFAATIGIIAVLLVVSGILALRVLAVIFRHHG